MIEILIDIMFIKRNQISLNCHSDQTSLLTAIWTNTMGISLNRSSVSIGCALAFTLILSTVQAASLPKDIEVDITMKKITSLIEAENYIEALPYFEELEAMNISLPEGFYYFQIKSLDKTTDTKKTLIQAESYFTDYGKDGKYYNAVVEIYSRVSMREAKEEAIASALRIKTDKELAEKKRIESGWRKVTSVWYRHPISSNGCSQASSRINQLHSSARNIDCDCSNDLIDHPAYYGLYATTCNITWQRNPLLENNTSLRERSDFSKSQRDTEVLRSKE